MAKAVRMYHSSANGYGENVAYKGATVSEMIFSPAGMTASWYLILTDIVNALVILLDQQGREQLTHTFKLEMGHRDN